MGKAGTFALMSAFPLLLYGSSDAPRFEGDGPPIEFGIRMRRFDREDELHAALDAGVDADQLHRRAPRG